MNPTQSTNPVPAAQETSILTKAVVVTGKVAVVAATVAAFAVGAFASYNLLSLALCASLASQPPLHFIARIAASAAAAAAVGVLATAALYTPFSAGDFSMYEYSDRNSSDVTDFLRHNLDGALDCLTVNPAVELGNSRVASLAANLAMQVARV